MSGRLENDRQIGYSIDYMLTRLPAFAKEWYLTLKASEHSMMTCKEYLSKLQSYLQSIDFFCPYDITAEQLTNESVLNYFLKIQTTKDKNGKVKETSGSYRQTIWFILNNFFEFMVKRGYVEHNFVADIKKPTSHDAERINRNRVLMTVDDYRAILSELDEEIVGDIFKKRDKAIFLVFMNTGVRATALRLIDLADLDLDKKELVVIDKGNIEHKYILNDMCINAIKEWLAIRDYYADCRQALFVSRPGMRLSKTALTKIVCGTCERALGVRLSPHKLRAGFCSIMYAQTHDIEKVRRMVGHKNIATTMKYIVTDNKEKEEAADIMQNLLSN